MTDWADLEVQVRQIAETHWNGKCEPRYLSGVKFDGIIEVRDDYWIAIEISKDSSLDKLRTDLAKFAAFRLSQMSQGVFTECYFVTSGDTHSLKDTGRANKIEVLSVDDFSERFVGKRNYIFQRIRKNFGSAVDPDTGEIDNASYADVSYISDRTGERIGIQKIADRVLKGDTLVLLGDFGTGKSRCVQEVFKKLDETEGLFPVLAINLRECWGLSSYDLIIRSHMESLGLSEHADNLVKLASVGRVRFLLDGFDEIGSQSWTGEAERLREIRRRSLLGVHSLISNCGAGGILITGREHYFSSAQELIDCLGVSPSADFIRCPTEFSEEQLTTYLISNTALTSIPSWMPRKPLICQLFAKLDTAELSKVTEDSKDECGFFETFLKAICLRERRIHASIDENILKGVLFNLAERTREKAGVSEEISPDEINSAFFDVSGLTPLDESAVMLQRLPYLGRTQAGNSNRTFIDDYAKSGLRGLALRERMYSGDRSISQKKWIKGIGEFGARILSEGMSNWSDAYKYGKYCQNHGNGQVAADLLVARLSGEDASLDFGGFQVSKANIEFLDFEGLVVKNLNISDCIVVRASIEYAEFVNCKFSGLIGEKIAGVGSLRGLPDCFDGCEFEELDSADNVARISELPLTGGQKTLISIIKKLFFQKGRGRKEEALLRGLEEYWDRNVADAFIRYALKNGIVVEGQGNQGRLYIPQRRHTKRMAAIVEKMGKCGDEIWTLAGTNGKIKV